MDQTAKTKIQKTDAEWRKELTPEQYRVTREHGTERPFTSPLLKEKRTGMFNCVACGAQLFASNTKFESGTGWPSFSQAIPGAITEHHDDSHFMRRTEIRCASCDAHLGHVFPDGPTPTGQRYCMNGCALTFDPKTGEA